MCLCTLHYGAICKYGLAIVGLTVSHCGVDCLTLCVMCLCTLHYGAICKYGLAIVGLTVRHCGVDCLTLCSLHSVNILSFFTDNLHCENSLFSILPVLEDCFSKVELHYITSLTRYKTPICIKPMLLSQSQTDKWTA